MIKTFDINKKFTLSNNGFKELSVEEQVNEKVKNIILSTIGSRLNNTDYGYNMNNILFSELNYSNVFVIIKEIENKINFELENIEYIEVIGTIDTSLDQLIIDIDLIINKINYTINELIKR